MFQEVFKIPAVNCGVLARYVRSEGKKTETRTSASSSSSARLVGMNSLFMSWFISSNHQAPLVFAKEVLK